MSLGEKGGDARRGASTSEVPALAVSGLSFSYPGAGGRVLDGASLAVPQGAFALLVGGTGSGKTTLLRLCKPEISPEGELAGTVEVLGRDVRSLSAEESAAAVGYVFQNPDAQIVCDTVEREMTFGMEGLGVPRDQMRRRVAETCYFLGMEPWLHARTAELSGGQRQLLALAATLVMRPRVLLLDEPTSMLDPVAERGFLSALHRVNRELGVTVVVATHRPAAMLDYVTLAFEVHGGVVDEVSPGGLREEGRLLDGDATVPGALPASAPDALRVSKAWFRYGRDAGWVLRDADLRVRRGEVRALLGGNGSGKSTLLALVTGMVRPQHGRVANALHDSQAVLPQSPKALLACQSVGEELMEWSRGGGYGRDEAFAMLARVGLLDEGPNAGAPSAEVPERTRALLARHPYDLSGGQQQLLALAKLLLVNPRLLVLDEPTKGLDWRARSLVARAVAGARSRGVTVVLATHDTPFVRQVADSVSLLFDGQVTLTQPTGEFFRDSWVWR